jgi:two-component system, sensor histidine kinase LadS
VKSLLLALMFVVGYSGQLARSQTFDKLYTDSPQPTLVEPLQWLAVPKIAAKAKADAGASTATVLPSDFITTPQAWPFQSATPRTQLPTSASQDVWMRFTFLPTDTVNTWYLRIPRINPVQVTLFTLDVQGVWQPQAAGNTIAPAKWPLRTRAPTFELKTSTTAQQTHFIKFENSSVMAEHLQMLSAIEYATGAYGVGAMLGMLVGMFSLLAAGAMAAYGLSKNTVFLWLATFVVAMLINQLVLLGFAGWQLWPGSQQLNQNMPWATSFIALASGSWLLAKASYAQDTHPWAYRLLKITAILTLVLGVASAVDQEVVPRHVKNVWAGAMVVMGQGVLGFLTWRGNRFNGWLVLGALPIGLSALNRIAYNFGWLVHVEVAQMMGMLGAATGLMVFFSALVWRSRASLLSGRRTRALADYDAETGLLVAEKAKIRLPRLLMRGSRLRSGSGVLLLRWTDAPRYAGLVNTAQRSQILMQIGALMRSAARDIDSAIRLDEDHFLMLIEGPISRDALTAVTSQIMAAALRGADASHASGASNAVNLHIAIWQDHMSTTSASNVMALLKRRLNSMGQHTQRRVQFIDGTAGDDPAGSQQERDRRKQEVLDKIREIEGEPTQVDLIR